MAASELGLDLLRLVVATGAGMATVPLVRRSASRRSTCLAILFGVLLTLVPSAIHLAQADGQWVLSPSLLVLARLDVIGFAFILYGVMLGLRDASRAGEKLRSENGVLKREATTDFLTGLPNRRHANSLLDYGAARARRSGDPLGFIMIDLDHFKKVNDTLGHQAGDAVLTHVAKLLKGRVRGSDIIARYGGEEFLVVLPGPSPKGILALAEDLRRLIEQNPAEHEGRSIPVTASFGVAISYVQGEEAIEESIGQADAALYAAKAQGRNRVVSWEATNEFGRILGRQPRADAWAPLAS